MSVVISHLKYIHNLELDASEIMKIQDEEKRSLTPYSRGMWYLKMAVFITKFHILSPVPCFKVINSLVFFVCLQIIAGKTYGFHKYGRPLCFKVSTPVEVSMVHVIVLV